MIRLKEIMGMDLKPPLQRWDDSNTELEIAAKSPFTAWDYVLRNGPNEKLWQVIKGSPYERSYVQKFGGGRS
jgi:hypothetical protein